MSSFAQVAYKIRHSALLNKAEWLWNIFRKPYHYFLNFKGNGVKVNIDNELTVSIPPQFYKIDLADYEKESIVPFIQWVKRNPDCLILDIGCAIGYFTTIGLFASEEARVIGFDSDLSSLRASQLMSAYAKGNRFDLIYGLVSDETTSTNKSVDEAIESTKEIIKNSKVTGETGTTKYINLDMNIDGSIPTNSIDDLFTNYTISQSKTFLKCDVEGAELFVLRGAKDFLRKYSPTILLSVHPSMLPSFNHTKEEIKDYLSQQNYTVNILAVDHEEHWWCEKANLS